MYYYCDSCGVLNDDDVEQKLIYEAIYYPNDDARPAEYDDLTCKGCGSYVMDYRCHDCMVAGDKDDEKLLVDEKHNMLCSKCFIKNKNGTKGDNHEI